MADFFAARLQPGRQEALRHVQPLEQEAGRGRRPRRDADGRDADRRARATAAGRSSVRTGRSLRSSSNDPAGDALSRTRRWLPSSCRPIRRRRTSRRATSARRRSGPSSTSSTTRRSRTAASPSTLKVADLSTAALLEHDDAATGSQSLLWVLRFTNGYQDAAASARWNPVQGFTFGFNDFTTGATPCAPPGRRRRARSASSTRATRRSRVTSTRRRGRSASACRASSCGR